MNNALIPLWIITEKQGTIFAAHCMGCMAGLFILFYLEAWTKINGKLSCTQVKCSWILPTYVKEVKYERVRDINSKSAKKMKDDLDKSIDCLPELPNEPSQKLPEKSKESSGPAASTEMEMNTFYAKLSKCKVKPVALSLVSPYAEGYVAKSRTIPTLSDLFKGQYLDLTYTELLNVCKQTKI